MRTIRLTALLAAPDASAEQVTQLLPGERVEVQERSGDWLRIVAPAQWSSQDPVGYPGWARAADLALDEDAVVAIARTYVGTPYLWGGLTHDGIDCSGLVHASLRAVGVEVPRDAADQAARCEPVVLGQERPGDLWFFTGVDSGDRITHVGLWTGPDTLLHAPDSGPRLVVEEALPDERRPRLVAAGRF